MPPFCTTNSGIALRAFTDACNSSTHPLGQHPEDYTLFYLGEFDDSLGNFAQEQTPRKVATGLSVLKPKMSAEEKKELFESTEAE
jgi:hypothetical protein